MKKKQKKRHKSRLARGQARDSPRRSVAIPAYISDPSISIDRISRFLLHDLRGREAAQAGVLYEAAALRIDPELAEMLRSKNLRLARRGLRIFERVYRAHLLVNDMVAATHSTIGLARGPTPVDSPKRRPNLFRNSNFCLKSSFCKGALDVIAGNN